MYFRLLQLLYYVMLPLKTSTLIMIFKLFWLQNILHLVRIMLVLPVSSAQCERGFSTQKRIKSDIRSALNPNTVEDLIRISVEGPPLETFDASVSVKRWMEEGQRARRPNFKSWPQDIA